MTMFLVTACSSLSCDPPDLPLPSFSCLCMMSVIFHALFTSESLVINTGPTPLCLFTVYAPAEHNEKTVHKTKEEGDELEEAGKDEAPGWAKKD